MADADDDGVHSLSDAVFMVADLFRHPSERPIPKAPFPDCGTDPTPDTLDQVATSGTCAYPPESCP